MYRAIVFYFVLIYVCPSSAIDGVLKAQMGTWTFSTKNISATEDSKSGFGAYSLQIGYALMESVQGVIGLNVLMSDGFGGSQGYGLDSGINYYPFTHTNSRTTNGDQVNVVVEELFRPYIGAMFKQRTFNFTLSTTYIGGGINVGCEYVFQKGWAINAEVRYDLYFGPDDSEATQLNFLTGLAIDF